LQNPVVRCGKKGRYFVIAGGRGLAALRLLVEAGDVAADLPVTVSHIRFLVTVTSA
jgi:ParB family chromosome partitioning protein